jgi:tetratricopeptide (TPR) repeat protein
MKNVTSQRKRNATVSVFTLLALLLAASGARAEEVDSSRVASASKLSEEGLFLYKGRDYRHAIEKFLQAFALDPDPNLLFNTARCYEAMGDNDNALEKYEAFLSKPDADPQGKRRATDAVRALREAKEAPSPIVPPVAKAPSATPAVEAAGSPAAAKALAPAPQAEGSSSTAAIVTLSAGVVSLAAGAVAYALGRSDHNKVTGAAGYGMMGQVDPMTEGQAQALVDSGKTKKLIGVIGMGLGGALVATSAALFMFGSHDEMKEPGKVAIGIAPTGDGGRLLLQGRF